MGSGGETVIRLEQQMQPLTRKKPCMPTIVVNVCISVRQYV